MAGSTFALIILFALLLQRIPSATGGERNITEDLNLNSTDNKQTPEVTTTEAQQNLDKLPPESTTLPSEVTTTATTKKTSSAPPRKDGTLQQETTQKTFEEDAREVALENDTTTIWPPLQLDQDATTIAPIATSSTTETATTVASLTTARPSAYPRECINDGYCLNGGTCVLTETGQRICICPVEFYGARCQTRNICRTVIVEQLTGEEICRRIGTTCLTSDKIFRCDCPQEQYFIFRANHPTNGKATSAPGAGAGAGGGAAGEQQQSYGSEQQHGTNSSGRSQQRFDYDAIMTQASASDDTTADVNRRQRSGDHSHKNNHHRHHQTYLAECRKIDKCIGVRCRQMSETCQAGECVCNRQLGYLRDPSDGLCKLLDPCRMAPRLPDAAPICGQATCVATYDRDLFRCVCPIGYKAVKVGEHRNSTQCALITDLICKIPLLNKCQHICQVDRYANSYRCSCLPGYSPGTRKGLDEHMCFFDEHLGPTEDREDRYWAAAAGSATSTTMRGQSRQIKPPPWNDSNSEDDEDEPIGRSPGREADGGQRRQRRRQKGHYVFKRYALERGNYSAGADSNNSERVPREESSSSSSINDEGHLPEAKNLFFIKREFVSNDDQQQEGEEEDEGADGGGHNSRGRKRRSSSTQMPPAALGGGRVGVADEPGGFYEGGGLLASGMSAQERCNMYCEPNKICVLEEGTADSYRCVCDRQGYVSIGDRCLDWCSAAEFSHTVQYWLEQVCYSGSCRPSEEGHQRPSERAAGGFEGANKWSFGDYEKREVESEEEEQRQSMQRASLVRQLEFESSWRPQFECECSNTPLLFKDPASKLCKLNFTEILRPCQPGNVGHTDCVVNKNAYCAVLHWPTRFFLRDLLREQPIEPPASQQMKPSEQASSSSGMRPSSGSGVAGGQPGKMGGPSNSGGAAAASSSSSSSSAGSKLNSKQQQQELNKRLYTCVCSPEKKFLVDKPRNKARCIDECNLLSNECGRFNRMCRAATIDSEEDFGRANLVRFTRDGVRMNQFKRTGCECLPGFNVGPSESVDFTLDDNNNNNHNGNDLMPAEDIPFRGGVIPLTTVGANQAMPGGGGGGGGTLASLIGGGGGGGSIGDWADPYGAPAAIPEAALIQGEIMQEFESLRTKYMNINSRCLLDYDVVEFHATFKAPADFEPAWVNICNCATPVAGQPPPPPPPPFPPFPQATGGPKSSLNETTTTTTPANSNVAPQEEEEELAPAIADEPAGGPSGGSQAAPRSSVVAGQDRSIWRSPVREASFNGGKRRAAKATSGQFCATSEECLLKVPSFVRANIEELHKSVVLVAQCDPALAALSIEAYGECTRYRYWIVQKLRLHFSDWRRIMTNHLRETFDLMDGNIKLRVNKCEATIKQLSTIKSAFLESMSGDSGQQRPQQQPPPPPPQPQVAASMGAATATGVKREETSLEAKEFDALDQYARVDANIQCELTIHSATSDDDTSRRHARKVLLEKQLPKFIFSDRLLLVAETSATTNSAATTNSTGQASMSPVAGPNSDYYLMAPDILIQRASFDYLGRYRKLFSPCKSDYAYCDNQTKCEMVDSVNFSCTCEYGYTPIGSRDIFYADSRKEVCEDIDECLFDVCRENGLENRSVCINEIGDYRCQCIRHHVGDNKRYCEHICNIIQCKFGDCRLPDEHHAFCECFDGYREADCSVQDPSVALRKANMIICGSIFASVLLLAITLAISLNSQLKKTKKKLKRLEAANEAAQMFEMAHHQQTAPPFRSRLSKVSICS